MPPRELGPNLLPLLPHTGAPDYERGAALLETALARAPQDPKVLAQLAAALARIGQQAGR